MSAWGPQGGGLWAQSVSNTGKGSEEHGQGGQGQAAGGRPCGAHTICQGQGKPCEGFRTQESQDQAYFLKYDWFQLREMGYRRTRTGKKRAV